MDASLCQPKEGGQGLVEYALILIMVAIVVIVILALFGPAVGNIFSNIMPSYKHSSLIIRRFIKHPCDFLHEMLYRLYRLPTNIRR